MVHLGFKFHKRKQKNSYIILVILNFDFDGFFCNDLDFDLTQFPSGDFDFDFKLF